MKEAYYKKGQTVNIYQDPITQTKLEGTARLKRFMAKYDDGTEYWEVEFTSEPGSTFSRLIMPLSKEDWLFKGHMDLLIALDVVDDKGKIRLLLQNIEERNSHSSDLKVTMDNMKAVAYCAGYLRSLLAKLGLYDFKEVPVAKAQS